MHELTRRNFGYQTGPSADVPNAAAAAARSGQSSSAAPGAARTKRSYVFQEENLGTQNTTNYSRMKERARRMEDLPPDAFTGDRVVIGNDVWIAATP